jgi:hypothetical protein
MQSDNCRPDDIAMPFFSARRSWDKACEGRIYVNSSGILRLVNEGTSLLTEFCGSNGVRVHVEED